MQTILGAGGVIGRELAKELPRYTDHIRLVSRNPERVNADDETFRGDLLVADDVLRAVEGSDVAYLVAGLRYSLPVWRAEWPVIMANVIEACTAHGTKLVFFDNVYLYGRVNGWMTEDAPIHPSSKKGEVRARLHERIMREVEAGRLRALIARAADFYGPGAVLSFVQALVFDRLAEGRRAQWLVNDRVRHSLTYTPDAGRATALLGNTESAYGQVWHLPTDRTAPTGREFIAMAAREFGTAPDYRVRPKGAVRLAGLFSGVVRETVEMLYQNDSDYLFSSSKFAVNFDLPPTPIAEGIRATVRATAGR